MALRPTYAALLGVAATAAVTFALPPVARLPLLAGLLWLTVGLYIGMALMDPDRRHLRTEVLGGVPVLGLALASVWSPWLLALGWLLHPLWDLLHEPGPLATKIHPATVPFCIVYDVPVAALAGWVAWTSGV
ncbi:MAG: hypothetical protein ACPGQL_02585 [Thermoplasmatota archaeon]